MDPQIKHIKEKVNFLGYKLWPLLRCVSLNYRIDLWKMFMRPLFEMIAGLFSMEGKSNKEKILRLIRKTFKAFTLLKKNVDNSTVETLMGYDYEKRAEIIHKTARLKWEARKTRDFSQLPEKLEEIELLAKGERKTSGKVLYPKEVQELFNLKTAICPRCGVPCSSEHMFKIHQTYIPDNYTVLDQCKVISEDGFESKLSRKSIFGNVLRYVEPFIVYMRNFLGKS